MSSDPSSTPPDASGPTAPADSKMADAVSEARELEPLLVAARQSRPWRHVRRFWPLALIVLAASVFVASGAWKTLHISELASNFVALSAWSEAHPVLARATLVLALATIVSMGVPGGIVLVIASGMFLGTIEGGLLSVLGDGIGATVLFLAARRAMQDDGGSQRSALVARLRDGFAEHPLSYALFLRLVPVFPFGAVSVALAWLGCRYRLFVTTSMLGVLPSSIVYAALGAGLGDTLAQNEQVNLSLLSQPKFLLPLLALALLSMVPVLLKLRRAPRVPR